MIQKGVKKNKMIYQASELKKKIKKQRLLNAIIRLNPKEKHEQL